MFRKKETNIVIPTRLSDEQIRQRFAPSLFRDPIAQVLAEVNRRFTMAPEREEEAAIEPIRLFAPTPLVFQPGQPSVFYPHEPGIPFRGQEGIKKRLDVKIQALEPGRRIKTLFVGPGGTGKTALAWIVARRIAEHWQRIRLNPGPFYELMPNQFETKDDFDAFMIQVPAQAVIFIDELHVLQRTIGPEALFHTLADTGAPRYPLGRGAGWVDVPPTTSWITATTDPGDIDKTTGEAFRRRLTEFRLEAPDLMELMLILRDQDPSWPTEVLHTIAKRSGGLPWQALDIHAEVRDFAKVAGREPSCELLDEALEDIGVDNHGLVPEDRLIIGALINVQPYTPRNGEPQYKMSQAALMSVAGLDEKTFKRSQGKLLRKGYLITVGGQRLTEKALHDYGHLKNSS